MPRLGLLSAALLLAAACEPSEEVGRCTDADLAETVVYDSSGFPAYAGQALMQQSCGNGAFCHSSGIGASNRVGAPHGMDFDMVGSRDEMSVDEDALERLARGREMAFEWRDEIYGSVRTGFMPPGNAGFSVVADVGYRYGEGTKLPSIESAEGQEILRNWLACGPPVVGSVIDFPDSVDHVGDVVPRGSAMVPEPNFTSIYEVVIAPHCANNSCHGPGPVSQIMESSLDLSSRDMAYMELVGVDAEGSLCGGMGTLVVAGSPDTSLLIEKMTEMVPSCGAPMPLILLPPDIVEPIRAWIEMGAADD